MAIVNVTPDSFFAGSRRQSEAEIATATERAVRDGAGIIDLGGYSSRPGADDVSTEEEFGRLESGFRRVREVAGEAFPVSVDTFRAPQLPAGGVLWPPSLWKLRAGLGRCTRAYRLGGILVLHFPYVSLSTTYYKMNLSSIFKELCNEHLVR